jgi:hypothetical protein
VAETDTRVLIPRVRRAVEGIGAPERFSDDDINFLIADSIADVILYTGGMFGKDLLVTARDPDPGPPSEYATSDELTFPEESMIAAQAALTAVYQQLSELKVQETIRDEGQEWSYALSATLMRDRIKQLQSERDKALTVIASYSASVTFIDLWRERDALYGAQFAEILLLEA